MDLTVFASLVSNLPLFGYILVFISAFLEVTVLVGALYPGQNIIMASGFFASQGYLNIFYLIVIVFIGSMIGNYVSYYLGRAYGDSLLNRYAKYFYVKDKHISLAKMFMRMHSGKSMIFGRFNHIVRAFVPFLAGVSRIGFASFTFYNIIGTAIWTALFVALGYIFGESYTIAFKYLGMFSIVILVGMAVLIYYFMKKYYDRKITVMDIATN